MEVVYDLKITLNRSKTVIIILWQPALIYPPPAIYNQPYLHL